MKSEGTGCIEKFVWRFPRHVVTLVYDKNEMLMIAIKGHTARVPKSHPYCTAHLHNSACGIVWLR